MKIREIISEADAKATAKKMPNDQVSSIKGAISMPGISSNKSNGNPYQQYRFGLALGVADGKQGGKMDPAGAFAGDPLLLTYTDEEYDMIKDAADMTEAGPINQLSRNKSEEGPDTHKVSPVPQNSGAKRKKNNG